jgi:hypothetical protein
MNHYSGKCSCGEVAIQFSSPQKISNYKSRRCDCDYCMQRGIEYLSDPHGQILFTSKRTLRHEKQGSEQATFLLCPKCQTVVGVCYIHEDISVGSVNARLLDQYECLQGIVSISPKRLSNLEKVGRWSELWSQVRVVIEVCRHH